METKINIVEILKDKPQGTKLYSSACGKCKLEEVDDKSFKISFYNSKFGFMNGGEGYLDKNGKLYDDGECIIFPSKEMRDWEKFSWKKGDVLVMDGLFRVVFDKWVGDDYTRFNAVHLITSSGGYFDKPLQNRYTPISNFITKSWRKMTDLETKIYMESLERECGGKLNLTTLNIEKQLEFKDGDIVVAEEDNYYDKVIFIAAIKDDIVSKALINVRYEDYEVHYNEYRFGRNRSLRLATEEEKQQLFDALAKEGKAWDAEKKQFVDIKKEHQFKPFEKVLVRDSYNDMWRASFFSHIKEDDGIYVATGLTWKFCIPYIGNESLVGTTKDVEG